ncbi:uncharacterized protein LOC133325708 [Musca vetustissima]|uniref:uncharacterized protein LOC133325708 n=1 Tax=Musca vetustissima TaxID=27455 RepID=UPI002AB5DEFB|nr:uncharacterized protein LOC133325708 [Musca vetustissima]
MSDILVECSQNQLRAMLDVLRPLLPSSIQQYSCISSFLYHFDKICDNRESLISEGWNLRFYTHRSGNQDNCTLISLTGHKDYIVTCFTLQESQEELKECLLKTNRIEWNLKRMYVVCDEKLFQTVNEIACQKVPHNWIYLPYDKLIYASKDTIQALQLNEDSIDDDLHLAELDAEKHANIVNEYWQYKHDQSLAYIHQCIAFNGGIGLFRGNEDQPIAWMTANECLAPGFRYTLPSDRRKGYSELVMKAYLKRLVKIHQSDLYFMVSEHNEASLSLHKKLGFEVVSRINWLEKP